MDATLLLLNTERAQLEQIYVGFQDTVFNLSTTFDLVAGGFRTLITIFTRAIEDGLFVIDQSLSDAFISLDGFIGQFAELFGQSASYEQIYNIWQKRMFMFTETNQLSLAERKLIADTLQEMLQDLLDIGEALERLEKMGRELFNVFEASKILVYQQDIEEVPLEGVIGLNQNAIQQTAEAQRHIGTLLVAILNMKKSNDIYTAIIYPERTVHEYPMPSMSMDRAELADFVRQMHTTTQRLALLNLPEAPPPAASQESRQNSVDIAFVSYFGLRYDLIPESEYQFLRLKKLLAVIQYVRSHLPYNLICGWWDVSEKSKFPPQVIVIYAETLEKFNYVKKRMRQYAGLPSAIMWLKPVTLPDVPDELSERNFIVRTAPAESIPASAAVRSSDKTLQPLYDRYFTRLIRELYTLSVRRIPLPTNLDYAMPAVEFFGSQLTVPEAPQLQLMPLYPYDVSFYIAPSLANFPNNLGYMIAQKVVEELRKRIKQLAISTTFKLHGLSSEITQATDFAAVVLIIGADIERDHEIIHYIDSYFEDTIVLYRQVTMAPLRGSLPRPTRYPLHFEYAEDRFKPKISDPSEMQKLTSMTAAFAYKQRHYPMMELEMIQSHPTAHNKWEYDVHIMPLLSYAETAENWDRIQFTRVAKYFKRKLLEKYNGIRVTLDQAHYDYSQLIIAVGYNEPKPEGVFARAFNYLAVQLDREQEIDRLLRDGYHQGRVLLVEVIDQDQSRDLLTQIETLQTEIDRNYRAMNPPKPGMPAPESVVDPSYAGLPEPLDKFKFLVVGRDANGIFIRNDGSPVTKSFYKELFSRVRSLFRLAPPELPAINNKEKVE